MNTKKILIAVAWPYVNGDLHVGHLAGYLLPADIMARYFRLRGHDVLMVSGSDCHGTPISLQADKEGKTPQEVADFYHQKILRLFQQYQLSYNLYTKTTTAKHAQVVQQMFRRLYENGYIIKQTQPQYYDAAAERFLPDRYVEGQCPYCRAQGQRGDQCEVCGKMIELGGLISPVSKISGQAVGLKEAEHYYLDLPKLTREVENYVDGREKIWRSWVYKESKGWLKEGLSPRAITRDLDWGVKLPTDLGLDLENIDHKRFYVWFEAVIGYLSAVQEWTERTNGDEGVIFAEMPGQNKDWREWWLNAESKHYYFLGQDNLVFHTIMWPAQLIGTADNYVLPHNVVANKFMNYEGKKFSKSRGWIVEMEKIAANFGVDPVRYYVAANLPENKEGDFSWDSFKNAVNNELIANFGNLVNRSLTFYAKHFSDHPAEEVALLPEVEQMMEKTFAKTAESIERAELCQALAQIMELSSFANKYFNDSQVWVVVKEDKEKAYNIMRQLLAVLQALSVLIYPFLPESSDRLRRLLGMDPLTVAVEADLWKYNTDNHFEVAEKIEPLYQKIEKVTDTN
jgi:methionyl-tRNA synthetase